jgi:hypothetical protein
MDLYDFYGPNAGNRHTHEHGHKTRYLWPIVFNVHTLFWCFVVMYGPLLRHSRESPEDYPEYYTPFMLFVSVGL